MGPTIAKGKAIEISLNAFMIKEENRSKIAVLDKHVFTVAYSLICHRIENWYTGKEYQNREEKRKNYLKLCEFCFVVSTFADKLSFQVKCMN